jgi:hypothetical protein
MTMKVDYKKLKDEKIVDIFIRSFHNGDYDVEFDNKLSADRGVILPTRATQASYNKPNNWRERNRIGLEKMKSWLQESTYDVDDQGRGLTCDWEQRTENDAPIVWHEPILDCYWNVLEARIARRGRFELFTYIYNFEFVNVEITTESMSKLVAISSATKSLEDIHFDNANLCEESIISLTKLVDVSSMLKILVIKHNRFDSMKSARCLSRSLKSHTCIEKSCYYAL